MRIGTYKGAAEYQCEQCGQEFSVPLAEAVDDDAHRACGPCKQQFASDGKREARNGTP